MKGRAGLFSYGPCSQWIRNHARSLGHVPGRGNTPRYSYGARLGYVCRCIRCDAVIAMRPSRLKDGYRMVGIIPECPEDTNFRYGWGI